jgi:hypothetical protein
VGCTCEITNTYKILVGSMAEKEAFLKTKFQAGCVGGVRVKLILKTP